MIRSSPLAVAAIVGLVTIVPASVAWANPAGSPAAAATTAATSTAASSEPAPAATQTGAEQRVEQHIKRLHAQLQITPAEEAKWQQFADVMRSNARAMDDLFAARAERYATMTALQDMQSYEQLAETHSQHLQKLVPAFANLYNAMPAEQQRLTDQVFRTNAEARVHRKMQTGRSR